MRVLKRDNTYEDVSLDKVQKRIAGQCEGLNVDIIEIAQKVCSRIHDGVKTSTLDDEAARLCAQLITKHPDYGVVAARIAISNHQKKTSPSFSETINMLYTVTDIHGNKNPLISDELWNIVQIHKDKLNSIINYDRDYNYDYFGFKTLERSYLLKVNGKIVERPQHMIMRVALGIHGWDLKEAIETYELMSTRYFTHATPTLFNAGTPRSQLASCYLMGMDDSITGMYKTLGDCAQISKYAGGIGIHIHDIRPTGSYIRGTNGYSTGIVPMLRVYNAAGRHVNQCFRGDTIIYTKTGYKNIESIEIGDNVITIDNTVKPVLGITRKEVDEELYVISCKWTQLNESREGVYVTGEHQIFTLDENDNIIEVSACELTTENYVGYPIALGPTSYVKLLHDMYWVKIDKIDKKHYKGFVYDLNIQDNHNYLTNMGIVHNSGKRNGSIAVYLEPWHSDIEAFLDLRKNSGNHEERCHDLFTAMWVPDLFMKRVDANQEWSLMCPDECPGLSTTYGDEFEALYTKYEAEGKYKKKVKAQTLFYSIMRSQIETGTPYMVYKDSANKKSNQMNIGTIKSSNLCVAPETMILTDNGYKNIKDIAGNEVNVWNGSEFSKVTVVQTGKMQKLLTIEFSNGTSLRCTPYHKFYIETGSCPSQKSVSKTIEAKDLKENMKLIRCLFPTLKSGTETMKYPYTHGLFCAEGTYTYNINTPIQQCKCKKMDNTDFCRHHVNSIKKYDSETKCCAETGEHKPLLYLYGEKRKLIDNIECESVHAETESNTNRITACLPKDIEPKYYVPINSTIETKIKWLEGYADGDGCVIKLDGIKNIQIGSINLEFLQKVLYMLQTMGINAKIALAREKCKKMMPDHRGDYKEYECQNMYRISIDAKSVLHLKSMGFFPKRLDIENCRAPHHMTNAFIKVKSVIDNNDYDDTYCFNEPIKHAGIFNGVITGNCSEITLFSDTKETAVCNLASIGLPTYVKYTKDIEKGDGIDNVIPYYDFKELHRVAQVITRNLNKVIDRTFYPTPETRLSNLRHRPIGIGVQGLANTYVLMRMPFESAEAADLNRKIFATIYHAALTASVAISRRRSEYREELNDSNTSQDRKEFLVNYLNMIPEEELLVGQYSGTYSSFMGSPASLGQLQYDLWGVTEPETVDGLLDWAALKEDIAKYGLRNSTLLAPMPTATTSQILGFNESFEAFTSNIYQRQTLAGEFTIINRHLIDDLLKLGLWNTEMKDKILAAGGSVQGIPEIPEHIRLLYKTVWEIKQKIVIDQSAERGPYVCQSQSLNIHLEDPDFAKMTNVHFYGWKKGLKTGMYYLRSRPKAKITAFTLDPTKQNQNTGNASTSTKQQPSEEEIMACRRDNPEGCVMCSG